MDSSIDTLQRLTKVETKMDAVLAAISSSTSFQNEVIGKLVLIASKQDDYKDYQRTCEAERKAHENRLTDLENSRKTVKIIVGLIAACVSLTISIVGIFIRHS